MTFTDFYDILDNEFEELIKENPHDDRLHKGDDSTRKSFAFLIWFLKFYGKRPIYNLNITEGDDDTSCDIIFSTIDTVGKKIFYVVQAKWKNKKNVNEKLDSTAFRATLDDFKLVYLGEKKFSSKNNNFNRQYEELKQHLAENQYVKFVYVTLTQTNPSVIENVEAFRKQCADFEIIDIERLRRDFIEVRYKQIEPTNPLEYDYNPDYDAITLPIEQLDVEKNYLRIDAPYKAYTFLIRPKTVFDLFNQYGFKLFFENIRNPLIASEYNTQIEETLKTEPTSFWYFNNGITAITTSFPNRVHATAEQIEITGLQIINGAQTVYSIYKAYKEAKNGERAAINNALVQFRLVVSVNKFFNLDITRYTNQQNPTEVYDFWANDPVQVRLQNESLTTDVWYQVRRGEFRQVPPKVKVLANRDMIRSYVAFVGKKASDTEIWTSNENYLEEFGGKKGRYEEFFNAELTFEELRLAHHIVPLFDNFKSFVGKNQGEQYDFSSSPKLFDDIRQILKVVFGENYVQRTWNKIKKDKNDHIIYQAAAFADEANKQFGKRDHWEDFTKVMGRLSLRPTEESLKLIEWDVYFGF
jgi:AIPR protein